MNITLNQDLSIVITDRLGNKIHEQQFEIKDFRSDEWHEFDHQGRSYELNTLDNGESLIIHMYNYGDTLDPNSIIADAAIEDNYKD